MVFVTACTPDYDKPWIFPALGLLRDRVVCLLDSKDDRPLPVNCERRDYQACGTLHQDGRFIHALPELKDDDIVVLLDADGVVQRPLNDRERHVLLGMNGDMAMGYNTGPGERGDQEYAMLHPKRSIEEAAERLSVGVDTLSGALIYNTGMMAGRVGTWKKLSEASRRLERIDAAGLFGIHSWPQYVICCMLESMGVPVLELEYVTHSHGHFPFTPKHEIRRRQLYYERRLVFFAHNTPGVTH